MFSLSLYHFLEILSLVSSLTNLDITHLRIYRFIHLFTSLLTDLSICLSIYLPAYLSLYRSPFLSTTDVIINIHINSR